MSGNFTLSMSGDDAASSLGIGEGETETEYSVDMVFGVLFLCATIVAAERINSSRSQGGTETTVVTAFYSLIFLTSLLRSIYFLVPNSVLQPRYTPSAVMAFSTTYKDWMADYISEVILTLGSLCLFSIFILILVYWADILKKYFYPGARRSKPMKTFVSIVAVLACIQVVNSGMFLLRMYSTEGMILVNSVLLSAVSVICVAQITIFSRKFRTVLQTLGAINQVSTESQVKRIKWITYTGNAFFFSRAALEVAFAGSLFYYYFKHGSVDKVFSHRNWDTYVFIKFGSEFAILCLMLYILKSRFNNNMTPGVEGNATYDRIPESEVAGKKVPVNTAIDV